MVVLLAYADQGRTFFCLGNGSCITVWKRLGGTCYVTSGKYRGVMSPDSYVSLKSSGQLTLFFSPSEPNAVIVEGNGLKIANAGSGVKFVRKGEREEALLYEASARTASDVKPGVVMVDLDVGPMYATDQQGQKLTGE